VQPTHLNLAFAHSVQALEASPADKFCHCCCCPCLLLLPLLPLPLLLSCVLFSHVFESVDDDVRGGVDGSSGSGSSSSNSKALLDSQIRGLEAALEEMRRKKQAAA